MHPLHKKTRALLWSVWSELGVPGGGRAHQKVVIDPEPIVAVTPHLARSDHRLLGLAFDWCRIHADQLSVPRLSGIAKTLAGPAKEALASFNGALALHNVKWQPRGKPLDLEPQRERMALPLERPALLTFRMRALCGVSARAEILTRLLFAPRGGLRVVEVSPSGMQRRNTELVLNELTTAGLVRKHGSPRRHRFSLADSKSLSTLVGSSGLVDQDWHRVALLLLHLDELASSRSTKVSLRRLDAVRIRSDIAPIAAALGQVTPPRLEGRDDAFEALVDWGTEAIP